MEDTKLRRGQLVSSSFNLFKVWIRGTKARLMEAQSKLDIVVGSTKDTLQQIGLTVQPAQLGKQFMPETSSLIGVPRVFGRDEERDQVIERLGVTIGRDDVRDHAIKLLGVPLTRSAKAARKKATAIGMGAVASTSRAAKRLKGESGRAVSTKTNCSTGHVPVPVLPIVGIGGVGKTTLAQYIYSDTRVKDHFDVMLSVCVSDIFDKRRITKELIETVTRQEFRSSGSLDALQVELKERLMRKKFLLVLDDVWPIAKNEWEAFFAPFRPELDGSMVLLTTRFPKVANIVSTVKPIELEGLPTDRFREFFKECAFGGQNPELYPQLQEIGQSIADRLRGSPLAAKTVGRLLSMNLTQQHWRNIQNSESWQLEHEENEILPALQLSYLYLPLKLKRCFAVCSIFPKDYSFGRDEIVTFWVAQCLVEPHGSRRLEDMGYQHLDDLRSRFLFQTDPRFPKRYVMHDLIHDMAKSVSLDECFVMNYLTYKNLQQKPDTIRHMSIEVDDEALSRMGGIQHLNKLHSLRFGMRLEVEVTWFKHLSNILFLSLRSCKLVKLPESICELKSLRCLDISGSSIQELPEKLWCLYSLQYFQANCLKAIHQDVIKLVNLRHLDLPGKATWRLSRISGLGNLSSLQNLAVFSVGNVDGRRIDELKGMNQLSGILSIYFLTNVRSKEEASGARLIDKQYLKQLKLSWGTSRCVLSSCHTGVMEGLHPPSSIESLEIKIFWGGGDSFPPSWLKPENLPALRILHIQENDGLKRFDLQRETPDIEAPTTSADGALGSPTGADSMHQASIKSSNYNACPPFRSLTALCLEDCRNLTNLDQFLSPEYIPSIQLISVRRCTRLESVPVDKFGRFVCLQDLIIKGCPGLVCPREMVLPHSLRRLRIINSGKIDRSIKPGCLENLSSLILLHLESCHHVESILLNTISTNYLKVLVLRDCRELSSIGGSHALSSIQHVDISGCPKLREVEQPLVKKGLKRSELSELQECFSQILSSDEVYYLYHVELDAITVNPCSK